MNGRTRLGAFAILLGACGRAASPTVAPAPSASGAALPPASAPSASSVADRCAFDAARLADLRARVAGLRAGMTRDEVDRALALDWSCFGGGGEGNPENYAVGYRITPTTTLAVTWKHQGGGYVLGSAALRESP